MNITILAVGKLKDRFFEEGCGEYQKRLMRYCTLSVREAADEKAPEALSPAQEEQVKESLASQRHPGKFPKVPGRRRGKRGFPAAPRERTQESFFNAL